MAEGKEFPILVVSLVQGEKSEQIMLGVGGVLDEGISIVDSAMLDALQRGQSSPGDLRHSLHYSVAVELLYHTYSDAD